MMSEAARQAKRESARAYREKNRERINAYQRQWNAANPDKLKEYRERHWEKVAAESK